MRKLKLSPENEHKKIEELLAYYNEKQSYGEAGKLLYLYNPNERLAESTQLLAKAGCWDVLVEISQTSDELTEKVILPAIKLEANIKINGLLEKITEFESKHQRLLAVQENKKLMPLILGEGGVPLDSDATSDFSDFSAASSKKSTSSRGSASSTSSKGSRKSKAPKNLLKRKVKEGSVLEEEWLVGTLKIIKYDDKMKGK